jgi:SsrA-binding protein
MKVICTNKRATFEYFILEKYEAGIKLKGTEIKAIREGHCNINDAYVIMKNNRPWIVNMFIAKYEFGNIFNHDELRSRELLLHKKECIKLAARIKQEGLTLVALRCYFEGSLVKVEIGLAKGKKLQDKREAIKEKDAKIRMEKEYKNAYR